MRLDNFFCEKMWVLIFVFTAAERKKSDRDCSSNCSVDHSGVCKAKFGVNFVINFRKSFWPKEKKSSEDVSIRFILGSFNRQSG